MIIDRVTFTGADDSIDPVELALISKLYPFVEWGILFSKSSEGNYRFPTTKWINRLCQINDLRPMQLSAHVCGRWVRDMLIGNNEFAKSYLKELECFQRIQWNFHAEKNRIDVEKASKLLGGFYKNKSNIIQFDGVHNNLFINLQNDGAKIYPLFDTSGGAGIVPKEWPEAIPGVYCGYAGGLGPDSLLKELFRINSVVPENTTIWIDMERKLRSDDDSVFYIGKCLEVLRILESYKVKDKIQI